MMKVLRRAVSKSPLEAKENREYTDKETMLMRISAGEIGSQIIGFFEL
jgi:hypothetical protein